MFNFNLNPYLTWNLCKMVVFSQEVFKKILFGTISENRSYKNNVNIKYKFEYPRSEPHLKTCIEFIVVIFFTFYFSLISASRLPGRMADI